MPISPSSENGYEFNSIAEQTVYRIAFKSGVFDNQHKFLFHSLSLVDTGNRKLKGEVDFVYLDDEAILFLEIKGGQVKFDSLKNEWWVLGGTEPGDPFKQAYSALFHTRDVLLPKFFKSRSISNRLIFGIGVIFPDCIKPKEFKASTQAQMEYDPDLICDYNDLQKKDGLFSFIEKVKKYWSNHSQYRGRNLGISSKESSAISKYFRKDLHFKFPISDLLRKVDNETDRLTNMQSYTLDNLKFNPGKGAIVMGGPGTGKTVLALELLKRISLEGKRCLLVCYNKNLAEHLTNLTKKLLVGVAPNVRHLHGLYMDREYSDMSPIYQSETDEYWSEKIPLLFSKTLFKDKEGYFDYIIIDEGQDLLNEYHFDAIGKLLKGGLETGNWTIFMDKEFQNIYNHHADDYFQYLREVFPSFITLLSLNCRNTLSTIKRASIQTGLPEMPCLRTDQNWKSEIKFYGSTQDLLNKISDTISQLEKYGIEKGCITVLCFEVAQVKMFVKSDSTRYVDSAFSLEGKINITTIHSYKGLENRFVLVCGPSDYDPNNKKQMSLIYIANTRATAQSVFYLDNRFQTIIEDRISNLS